MGHPVKPGDDGCACGRGLAPLVIPAQAGIQLRPQHRIASAALDPGFRRGDGGWAVRGPVANFVVVAGLDKPALGIAEGDTRGATHSIVPSAI